MSTKLHDNAHEDHSGPIKTPKSFLWASQVALVLPVAIIIGLVYFVTSAYKPEAGTTESEQLKASTARIQKVGTVEVRDANRPLKSGEEVFKAQCAACHETGAAGAPKFGDKGAWGKRIAQGFEALVQSALKGKGSMGAQGGGDFDDIEIARAVAYLANAGGASFKAPEKAAAPAADATAADASAAPAGSDMAVAAAVAGAAGASAAASAGATTAETAEKPVSKKKKKRSAQAQDIQYPPPPPPPPPPQQ